MKKPWGLFAIFFWLVVCAPIAIVMLWQNDQLMRENRR